MAPRTKSIDELRRELAAKERELGKLQARRTNLLAKLDAVDKKIAALGGSSTGTEKRGRRAAAPRAAGRARRAQSDAPLAEYIRRVLAKSPKGMRTKDIVDAALSAGYKTTSDNFYGIVAPTLRDMPDIERVARGVYKLTKK